MKLLNPFIAFFFCLLFVYYGCDQSVVNQKDKHADGLENNSNVIPPKKTYFNPDSLKVHIPGQGNFKKPKVIISEFTNSYEYTGMEEIIPGISNLPQTIQEKIDGVTVVKSKKPIITFVDFSKIKKEQDKNYEPPVKISVSNPIILSYDSISNYRSIALNNGSLIIQNGDSIFAPMSVIAKSPKFIKALPLKYSEDAVFDISFLKAKQGIPNSVVRDIAMDTNNELWFASFEEGLMSYNGKYFKHYTEKNGLSDNQINTMIVDGNNQIWFGTQNGGVNCFNGQTITHFTTKQGLPTNHILDIIEDSKGNIWFATTHGVGYFDGSDFFMFTKDQGLAMNVVVALCEDDDGNIWMGTYGKGVSMWNGEKFTTFTTDDGLALNTIYSISKDHLGNLWFGSLGGGVSKFDGKSFVNYATEQGLAGNVISSIVEDNNNNIWFATHGYGISRFNGKSFTTFTEKDGLTENYCRTLFNDNFGNIWVGTDGAGAVKINMEGFVHLNKEKGLRDDFVTALMQDSKGRYWVSNYNQGLLIYDEFNYPNGKDKYKTLTAENGLADNVLTDVLEDKEGNFWFSTHGLGFSKLDGESFDKGIIKFTNYSEEQGLLSSTIHTMLEDDRGNVWFGTENGLSKFNGENFISITKKNGLGAKRVNCSIKASDGTLWFGISKGGISCLKNDTIINYKIENGLSDNTVKSIIQDYNDILWIATMNGLSYFDGKSFNAIYKRDGLSGDNIHSLTMDNKGSLWVGTTKGLSQIILPDTTFSKYKMKSYKNLLIYNYGLNEGLKYLDFNSKSSILDKNNRLLLGTKYALTLLDLNNFDSKRSNPIVHIDELKINNELINFNEVKLLGKDNEDNEIRFNNVSKYSNIPTDLSLPYTLNNLSFSFSAIDWKVQNQLKYQFKLKGLDDEWQTLSDDALANYRNIPYGNYTFMARVKSNNLEWGDNFEFPFSIRPPWWLKWWSIMFYIISFLLMIWQLFNWRVGRIRKQKIILEDMVASRTKELDKAVIVAKQATAAKSQFVATMSHEIRTPLTAIMGLTYLAKRNASDPKQSDYLQKINRSANTMLSLINDILDFSKIEAGKMQLEKVPFNIEEVLNSIIVLNNQQILEKNLELVVIISPDLPSILLGDSLRIGQVITNLCSNAIKFTSKGEVVITVSIGERLSEEELVLTVAVKDTGIGISEDKIPVLFDEFEQADNTITRRYGGTGLGLAISKSLVNNMGGKIWIESIEGKGSTFFFDLKVGLIPKESSINNEIPDQLKNINILVCDNNISVQKSIELILQSFSSNLVLLGSADEVISQLNKKHFDLLIINQDLDGKRGSDIIFEVISNPNFLPIKTLLIVDSEKSIKGIENNIIGIDDFLVKPIMPSIVFEKILNVFEIENSFQSNLQSSSLSDFKYAISGSRILLVEDNEINRQVILELIEKMDTNIDLAFDGAEAVKKSMENEYDLVLMDLHMPVMDGYYATEQIRKHNTKMPVIAVTADARNTIKDKCEKVGINDIITKPIDPDILYKTLLKWIPEKKTKKSIAKNKLSLDLDLPEISIPGLESKLAIKRFGNNERLYYNMLKKFMINNKDLCKDISELLSVSDFKKAHLLIHTLKGESANIGANKIYEQSKKVESNIINNEIELVDFELRYLQICVNEVISDLEKYFGNSELTKNANTNNIKTLIDDLKDNLEKQDPKVFDLLDALNENTKYKKEIKEISEAVNNGNYPKAFELIDKLQESNLP